MLHFKTIFVQKQINTNVRWRANTDAILGRFPDAAVVPVESHWQIPALFDADPAMWMQNKQRHLVLGVRTSMKHVENGRSADFIAAGSSNGCLSACQYCYVARRKGGSNPLTLFVNIEEIAASIERHQQKLGPKLVPNQTDPHLWTYDIGCNSDLSIDALICDNPGYLIDAFRSMPYAKATFATKTVNDDYWLRFDPGGHTRIRYSIMPQAVARYVDIGTSRISDRIASVNRLVDAGYEVHLNFSPIIIYGGDEHGAEQWRYDWMATWQELDDMLSAAAKAQLACEAFFLTHSAELHEINLQWNPRGENFLWTPAIQQPKRTKPDILVYDYARTKEEAARFRAGVEKYLPYCPVRYIF